MSATAKLRNLRMQKNIPAPPPMSMAMTQAPDLYDDSFGEPMPLEQYAQDESSVGTSKQNSIMSSGYMYIAFTALPAVLVGAALYFAKPGFIIDKKGEIDSSKLLILSALAGIVGFLIKFFLFK